MLTIRDLTIGYNGQPVLHQVSLAIEAGQMVALIGANGAGKSTLLRAMNRTLKPWSGSVALRGQNLAALSPRQVARRIALVEQAGKLAWPYTVEQVLNLGRFPHQGWFAPPTARDAQIVERVLRQTALWELRRRPLNTLSGGERQRALVARALVQEPQVLLLDEPASNLDIHHQHQLLRFVRGLVSDHGLAVVVAIHDLAMAARYCQRLVVINRGRVCADGPAEAVLNPALLHEVFGVQARLYRDPLNHHWALSVT